MNSRPYPKKSVRPVSAPPPPQEPFQVYPEALVDLTENLRFPKSFTEAFQTPLERFVKKEFGRDPSWAGQPFDDRDITFFFKGVKELSQILTRQDERVSDLPKNYMDHTKYQSAYFLYWLPLQASKIYSLLDKYERAFDVLWKRTAKSGEIKILDFGCGPGTATIALLLWLSARAEPGRTIEVHAHWVDSSLDIMEIGQAFLRSLIDSGFIAPEVRVVIHSSTKLRLDERVRFDLGLFGNVINEFDFSKKEGLRAPFLSKVEFEHLILLEPASRLSFKRLVHARERLIQEGYDVVGPCLHQAKCPLFQGRDWCHMSFPGYPSIRILSEYGRRIGGRREWLKLNFFVFTKSSPARARTRINHDRVRVISDPIDKVKILLCAPRSTQEKRIPSEHPIYRGALVQSPVVQFGTKESSGRRQEPRDSERSFESSSRSSYKAPSARSRFRSEDRSQGYSEGRAQSRSSSGPSPRPSTGIRPKGLGEERAQSGPGRRGDGERQTRGPRGGFGSSGYAPREGRRDESSDRKFPREARSTRSTRSPSAALRVKRRGGPTPRSDD